MAAWIKMSLGMEVGLGPGDFVLDGGPRSPSLSAHVHCGQMAGWMKLVLGTEVGLSQGDFVLDGDPVPFPKRGGAPSQFSAHFYCGQTAACIKIPLGMELGLDPCLLWPRSPISATAELLLILLT